MGDSDRLPIPRLGALAHSSKMRHVPILLFAVACSMSAQLNAEQHPNTVPNCFDNDSLFEGAYQVTINRNQVSPETTLNIIESLRSARNVARFNLQFSYDNTFAFVFITFYPQYETEVPATLSFLADIDGVTIQCRTKPFP